jgi:hypothetical protein
MTPGRAVQREGRRLGCLNTNVSRVECVSICPSSRSRPRTRAKRPFCAIHPEPRRAAVRPESGIRPRDRARSPLPRGVPSDTY